MSNDLPIARRRPRAVLATALLVLALAATGCGASGTSVDKAASGASEVDTGQQREGAGASDARQSGDPTVGRAPKPVVTHVIRTASLTVRVKSVPEALEDARSAADRAGGYIGDETTDRDPDGHERSRVVLRVPQDAYEQTLDDLAGTGKLLRRKVDAKDVTDQVVDVESRIRSQKASVQRVRALMDRATELEDVVLLEGELNARQTELEALQAQQASLKERTGMATITLVLSETAVVQDKDDEPSFTDALAGGWDAFLTTVRWVAVTLGAVLPFAVAGGVLYVLWRAVRGRMPRRRPRGGTGGTGALPPAVPAPAASGEGRTEDRQATQG